MEKEKIDLIIGKNTKSFFIEKSAEKKNLQIVKVSGKIQQIIKFKMFFFFFQELEEKERQKRIL